jgi:hypothetical protein
MIHPTWRRSTAIYALAGKATEERKARSAFGSAYFLQLWQMTMGVYWRNAGQACRTVVRGVCEAVREPGRRLDQRTFPAQF